ncbi:MAG TPA: LysR family transcriptional regulator [Burkholderiaceae bacterium]|nr:LysR family transcriptional regulator [Burkholderiaceae bacterium]
MQHFDFNLLVMLDALLSERTVYEAAQRMNITPAAMSHALARLRSALGDPLLVRAGRGLVPTPRAEQIRDRVRELVLQGRSIFEVDPAASVGRLRRTFTVRANPAATAVLGATLIESLRAQAPAVQLRFAPEGDESVAALRDGSVDLDIGVNARIGPEIRASRLFEDRFVGLVGVGHPLARGRVTVQRYAAQQHVCASRRGIAWSPVDDALSRAGLSREVALVVPDALAASSVAAVSRYVATVPSSVARWACKALRAVMFELPLAMPPLTIYQSWHPRFDADGAHQWLRAALERCSLDLAGLSAQARDELSADTPSTSPGDAARARRRGSAPSR